MTLSIHETGRFRNFMSYERKWLESVGSEDSHGRALWALGVMAGWGHNPGQVALATSSSTMRCQHSTSFSDSRAIAFPVLGMQAYLRRHDNDRHVRDLLRVVGLQTPVNRFKEYATERLAMARSDVGLRQCTPAASADSLWSRHQR